MKRLLLWDIDGTLLASGGAGMRALQLAFQKEFLANGLINDIDFHGRTDRWIMRRIFEKFALVPSEENFNRLTDAYLRTLPAELAKGPARILPGVQDLLRSTGAHPEIVQGLLTGNLRAGAEAKLRQHGIWEHFPFGAFGDDAELRNDLGPHALRRAKELGGLDFPPRQVWIIGDTPHDIACARAIGANCLAVATGGHKADSLAAHHPTALLSDLSSPQEFWRALESVQP